MRRSPNCISVGDRVHLVQEFSSNKHPWIVSAVPTGMSDEYKIKTVPSGESITAKLSELEVID